MRSGGNWSDVRASALWGSGKRGTGSRSNALWGNGKRRTALLATLVLTLVVPLGASAVTEPEGRSGLRRTRPSVLGSEPAQRHVLGDRPGQGRQPGCTRGRRRPRPLRQGRPNLQLPSTASPSTSRERRSSLSLPTTHVTAITADSRVRLSAHGHAEVAVRHRREQVLGDQHYRSAAPAATIAIVDSGIDATAARVCRAHRRQRQPQLALSGNSPGRRARSRHFRGRHRREQSRGQERRRSTSEDRLPRRHGRQGHGEDKRRHRCHRLDPRQQVRSTASASRISRSIRLSPAASCTTRSTRRSRSSGSTTSWSWRLPETTASPTDRAASRSHPATTRS